MHSDHTCPFVQVIVNFQITCSYRCLLYVRIYLQFTQSFVNNSGVEPKAKSLQELPQKIDQYTLLLFKVFYNTKAEAEGGRLDSILCNEDDFIVDSNTVSIERTESDVAAVMRSGIFLPPSSCYS